ncbi:LysR substrate-binding domain-containing protein [Comamonadaceae bacterium PP-2]
MDLKLLNSFVAVAEEGQLSRAAARLNLSLPPLSRHIQALELKVGTQLFVRSASGMHLTQAGCALLEDARNIELWVQAAAVRAKKIGSGQSGHLSVGVYGSSMYGTTAAILRKFKDLNPEISLSLGYGQTPQQVQALRRGQVEIVFERMIPSDEDIEVHQIELEDLHIAVADSHRLASHDSIDIAELRDDYFLIGSEVSATQQLIEICEQSHFTPRLSAPSSSVVTATLLAASGMGVSLVPDSMTKVKYPGIVYLPIRNCRAKMALNCFYLKDRRSPILNILLNQILDGGNPVRPA